MTIMSTMSRGGKRDDAGRPKKDPSEIKKLIGLRIDDRQRARYQEAADLEAMDLLDWARKHLDAAADKTLGRK